MGQAATIDNSPQLQIQQLEVCAAAGDLAGMAGAVSSLHENWNCLSENEQQQILKLEAIFISLVHMQMGEA